jgi:hypothetical protein
LFFRAFLEGQLQAVVQGGAAVGDQAADHGAQLGTAQAHLGHRIDQAGAVAVGDQGHLVDVPHAVDQLFQAAADEVDLAAGVHGAGDVDGDGQVERRAHVGVGDQVRIEAELQHGAAGAVREVAHDGHHGLQADAAAAAGGRQLGVVLGEEAGGVEVLGLGDAVAGQKAAVVTEVLGAAQADVGVAGGGGGKAAGIGGAAGRARHLARAAGTGAAARGGGTAGGATGPELPGLRTLRAAAAAAGAGAAPVPPVPPPGRPGAPGSLLAPGPPPPASPTALQPARARAITARARVEDRNEFDFMGRLPSRQRRERRPLTQLACHRKPLSPPSNHPDPSAPRTTNRSGSRRPPAMTARLVRVTLFARSRRPLQKQVRIRWSSFLLVSLLGVGCGGDDGNLSLERFFRPPAGLRDDGVPDS